MSSQTRALAWLHARRLRGGLLGLPLLLAAVTFLVGHVPAGSNPVEWMLLALLPFVSAGLGTSVPGSGGESAALPWLRAQPIEPRRLLASGLAMQVLLLLACAASAAILVHFLAPALVPFTGFVPGEGSVTREAVARWAEMLDAPFGLLVVLSTLLSLAGFLWGFGLAVAGQSATTSLLGATLLSWLQAALLVVPGSVLSGRTGEALAGWLGLVPGFLLPPALLAAWAWHRWDPLASLWPRRRLVTVVAGVAALSLAGWALTLPAVFEARRLEVDGVLASETPVESSRSARHPAEDALVAREVRLRGGGTRVVLEDGRARRTVLPRGTELVGWVQPIARNAADWRLVVEWPNGVRRELRPNGRTSVAIPESLCAGLVEPEVKR